MKPKWLLTPPGPGWYWAAGAEPYVCRVLEGEFGLVADFGGEEEPTPVSDLSNWGWRWWSERLVPPPTPTAPRLP